MGDVGIGIKRVLMDVDGEVATVTSNRLDVNATLVAGATIDIGDVDLFLDGGTALLGGAGAVASGVLRVTLASDDPAVASLDEIEDAIEQIEKCVGQDGSTGPLRCLSIAGTSGLGNIQEIAVDSSGNLQVDLVTAAVTNAGTFVTQIDGDALTSLQLLDDAIYADDANWSDDSSKHMLVGGLYESSPQTVTNGDVAPLSINDKGMLKVDLIEVGGSSSGHWLTAGAGTTSSVAHIASSAYSTADSGFGVMAVMNTTLGALTNVSNGEYTQIQVNSDGALYVEVAEGVIAVEIFSGMQSDNNEDVSDTTAERIATTQACKRVDMQADPANTGYIYVGGSDVSATKGIRLAAGDFYSIDIDNLVDIWVLASVDGEDIHFTYFT